MRYRGRASQPYKPRRLSRKKVIFKAKLLKHLGDSHEARELTGGDLDALFEDYKKSGKSFKDWVKQFRD